MSKEFLTVSEFNTLVKDVVTYGFPSPLWICGEIQGYNRNRDKRHVFFEICEKNPESEEITARIGLVIFGNRKSTIQDILKQAENAFELKDDIEVKFLCKVDFYVPHGAVRLIVEGIDPVYTLGKIAQQRQKLIAELRAKGILEQNKSIELPMVPLNIGLITSVDSAAYNDFLSELKKSGYHFRVCVKNTTMQGKRTEKEVCAALKQLSAIKDIDVVVITRGGGSVADLSSFDSKVIAEEIAKCRVPVVSGIGHEIDLTITDLAAHTHQKTPTAIARFLVERIADFVAHLDDYGEKISNLGVDLLEQEKRRLQEMAGELQQGTEGLLKSYKDQLAHFSGELKRLPLSLLRHRGEVVGVLSQSFIRQVKTHLKTTRRSIQSYEKMIELVHPKNVLKKGFSITRTKNGCLIRSAKRIEAGTVLSTEVADGVISSEVVK